MVRHAPGSSVHLPRDPWDVGPLGSGNTLAEVATSVLESDLTRRFIFSPQTGWISRGDFLALSVTVSQRLCVLGARPGSRVMLVASGDVSFAAIYLGILISGCVAVPVNPGFTDRELAHVISDSRPTVIVGSDQISDRLADLAVQVQNKAPLSGVGQGLYVPEIPIKVVSVTLAVESLLDRTSDIGSYSTQAISPALLAYTSGTTGLPKGALLSNRNLLASVRSLAIAWRWSDSDRLLLALPLFHMHGLGVGLTGSLLIGSEVVLFDGFDASEVVAGVKKHEATMFFGVPTMYSALCATKGFEVFGRLRVVVSGSAPLTRQLFEAIKSQTGQPPIERYGMTETVMNISNPLFGVRKPNSVGIALPGVEVALASDGEILLRGDNVFLGYLNNEDATGESFADGWFKTGDIGRLDEDGYLYIESRKKDLIISGGYNVYPREVEDQIRAYPGVGDAAVVGRKSPKWGEEVVAFVQPSSAEDQLDLDGLLNHLKKNLVNYKVPKNLYLVNGLPRNAMGKIVLPILRQIADGDDQIVPET